MINVQIQFKSSVSHCPVVYLLLNYVGVICMATREVFFGRKLYKSYANTVKIPIFIPLLLYIFQSWKCEWARLESLPGQFWSQGLFDGRGLNPTGSHKDNCNIITVVWLGNICKHCILFISRACERCNCITFMQGPTLHVLYRVHLYLQHFPAVNNLKIL